MGHEKNREKTPAKTSEKTPGKHARPRTAAPPTRVPRGQRRVAPAVTVSESDGLRYLHFGSIWVQGAMRIARPYALALEYQQQMMAPALFLPVPQRVLQLGLGAAALTKFCWRYVPTAEITVVELSEAVVQTAQQWFRLPPEDARLTVVLEDAGAYIAHPRRRHSADWLQVDLYDAAAAGPVYDDVGFYRDCRRALARPGIAAFNLFGRSFDGSFAAIAAAFEDRVLVLPEADAGNRIVLGFNGPRFTFDAAALYARAAEIEAEWRLPARKWVSGLRSVNGLQDGEPI